LGVPPRIPIELDDSLLKTFELEDERLVKLREEIAAFQTARMSELDTLPTPQQFQAHFETLMGFLDDLEASLEIATADFDRWKKRHEALETTEENKEQLDLAAQAITKIGEVLLPDINAVLEKLPETLLLHHLEAATAEKPEDTFDVLAT